MTLKHSIVAVAVLGLGVHAWAGTRAIRQTVSDFVVNETLVSEMLTGDQRFYSVDLLTAEELRAPGREAFRALEYMDQDKLEDHAYLVSKHAYLLGRPAGFFSCELLGDSEYISALEKESVTRTGPMNYVLRGQKLMVYRYQFDLNWYADLPDCQNLSEQGTPAMQAGMEVFRGLDPELSFELRGTFIKDKPNFTQFLTSGWVYGKIFRVPHESGEKTLVITYEVSAMPTQYAIKRFVEGGHIEVMELEVKTNSQYTRRIRK